VEKPTPVAVPEPIQVVLESTPAIEQSMEEEIASVVEEMPPVVEEIVPVVEEVSTIVVDQVPSTKESTPTVDELLAVNSKIIRTF